MRKYHLLSLILLGTSALWPQLVDAEERSISISRRDGTEAYFCGAATCFEPGVLQQRYDSKLQYIKNHACKNATPSTNKHCSDEHETLRAIQQCANNYCSVARCLEKNLTTNRCTNSVFRR